MRRIGETSGPNLGKDWGEIFFVFFVLLVKILCRDC